MTVEYAMKPTTAPALNPWKFTDGNQLGEILIIAEYFSAEEQQKGKPLVGSAGWEFRKMFQEAGLDWNNTLRTVIAAERPRAGELNELFKPTKLVDKKLHRAYRGCYPSKSILEGAERLQATIQAMPNLKLIIGLGNLPLWLLTDKATITATQGVKVPTGAMKWRGSQIYTDPFSAAPAERSIPYLPLVSPSIVLKDWSYRFFTVHDLRKRAAPFMAKPESWTRGPYETIPKPTFAQAMDLIRKWTAKSTLEPLDLAVDIETWRRTHIACIGLSDDKTSICIPFFWLDETFTLRDYFTEDEEVVLWQAIRRLLNSEMVRVIGQNYSYDIQYLYRTYGIKPQLAFDTMLAHHLIWPGTPKSLDFLASLYCEHYIYWKDESQDWDGAFNHESLWTYNCKDTRETYDIAIVLRRMIEEKGLQNLWQERLDNWDLAISMMLRGSNVNKKHFEAISNELQVVAMKLEDDLLQMMPEDIRFAPSGNPWFTSPQHQMMIFYQQLGFAPVLNKKTKRPTLDATAIPVLREKNPWLARLFDTLETLRSIAVFRSHFLEMRLSFDGRLRTNFNVAGTETFRWSSSANGFGEGTNFQNIPKGDD